MDNFDKRYVKAQSYESDPFEEDYTPRKKRWWTLGFWSTYTVLVAFAVAKALEWWFSK